MSKFVLDNKGYTLIEALVALAVLVALVVMIMPGIARFLESTRADFVNMCVWESAISELNRVKANPTAVGQVRTYRCGALVVTVNSLIEGGALPANPPQPGSGIRGCALVRVQAEARGRTATVRGPICRLP